MVHKYLFIVLSVVYFVNCENANTNNTEKDVPVEKEHSFRKGREIGSYLGMISCAMKYDISCFVDSAQDYLEEQRTELLAQADAEVARATGRSDSDSRPSHLADVVGKLIAELINMFQNSFSGNFKSAREADDDDVSDTDDDDNDLTDATTSDSNGVSEMRELNSSNKKKKKKPLKSLIRLIKVALIAIIIVLKLAILLKILQTAMQFKFLLISLGGFAIQAAKLWMTIRDKKNQHGHEEIVYKNPYTSGDEYSAPGGAYGGEYNAARSGSAQDLAYSNQRYM